MARRLRTSPVGEREVAAAAFAEFFALVGASLFEREEEYLLSRRGGTKAPTLAKVFIDHIEITQLVGLMADDAREGVADPTLLERIAHRVERHLAFETGTIGGGVARPFRGCRRLS
jgi:hypothetical protein